MSTEKVWRGMCGRCGMAILGEDGYVLYLTPGGREARSTNRYGVHGKCIAEDVAAGEVTRVSPFAFERVAEV